MLFVIFLELIMQINNLLVEKHGQHHFTSFFWEIGQEQNLVRRLFSISCYSIGVLKDNQS